MGFLSPPSPPPLPIPPPSPSPPPMFGAGETTGKKPQRKSMFPTFLGPETSPSAGQVGYKTLLGQ